MKLKAIEHGIVVNSELKTTYAIEYLKLKRDLQKDIVRCDNKDKLIESITDLIETDSYVYRSYRIRYIKEVNE